MSMRTIATKAYLQQFKKDGPIDDDYLMQSTRLVDKNSKEVFVGDIIKCTRGCLHEVYIEKEYGGTYFWRNASCIP